MVQKIKAFLLKTAKFLFNPRFLLCFGIGWLITNGWSYLLFGLGIFLDIGWMVAISSAYLTFLWLPISPEKIVTVAIALWLLKLLFPRDKETLGVLTDLYTKAKQAFKNRKKNKS